MELAAFAEEEEDHPKEGDELAEDGGQGRPLDAELEDEDEQGIQANVQDRPDEGRRHGKKGFPLGGYEGIEALAQQNEDDAQRIDLQIRIRIIQRGLRAAEGADQITG